MFGSTLPLSCNLETGAVALTLRSWPFASESPPDRERCQPATKPLPASRRWRLESVVNARGLSRTRRFPASHCPCYFQGSPSSTSRPFLVSCVCVLRWARLCQGPPSPVSSVQVSPRGRQVLNSAVPVPFHVYRQWPLFSQILFFLPFFATRCFARLSCLHHS